MSGIRGTTSLKVSAGAMPECVVHRLRPCGWSLGVHINLMDESKNKAERCVGRLNSEWEEVHTQLRMMEQVLSDAVSLYSRGHASLPDSVLREVDRLRAICAQRFRALSDGLRA